MRLSAKISQIVHLMEIAFLVDVLVQVGLADQLQKQQQSITMMETVMAGESAVNPSWLVLNLKNTPKSQVIRMMAIST